MPTTSTPISDITIEGNKSNWSGEEFEIDLDEHGRFVFDEYLMTAIHKTKSTDHGDVQYVIVTCDDFISTPENRSGVVVRATATEIMDTSPTLEWSSHYCGISREAIGDSPVEGLRACLEVLFNTL